MKRIFLGVILLITVVFTSCKNNQEQEEKSIESIDQSEENLVKISFNLISVNDDKFHLYYTEDETINFNEEKSVWSNVKGSKLYQEVEFKLPKDVLPTNLRVDFGSVKLENDSDIELKSFSINYLDKNFTVKDSLIFNYFYPNETNTILEKMTLKRKDKNQEIGPILYPHIPLTEELKKIAL